MRLDITQRRRPRMDARGASSNSASKGGGEGSGGVVLVGQILDERYNACFGDFMNNEQLNALDEEARELYCDVHAAVKKLNELKQRNVEFNQHFAAPRVEERHLVITLCKRILFRDCDILGRKAREVLWRSGYYDIIATAKRRKCASADDVDEQLPQLHAHLLDAIDSYKTLVNTLIKVYALNMGNVIDQQLFATSTELPDSALTIADIDYAKSRACEAHQFVMETVHNMIVCLGDFHRYMLDFKLAEHLKRDDVAKYYWSAFRLNSANGNAQNQLGTLFSGRNHDMNSIYHYLFSLTCIVPFELSESNVKRLLARHNNNNSQLLTHGSNHFDLKSFLSRFYGMLDVLFFDKECVPEFNNICHGLLMELRSVLNTRRELLTEQHYFQLVSMLFFCMSRLKMIKSAKVTLVNAFLLALCADIVTALLANIEQWIESHADEQKEWQLMYQAKFDEFERLARKSRADYRTWMNLVNLRKKHKKLAVKGFNQQQHSSFESRESQQSLNEAAGSQQQSSHQLKLSTRSSDEAKESDLKTPMSGKSKRRGMRLRRRKRKTELSDDSSCYDSESELGSDFASDEEDYTDLSSNIDGELSDFDAIEMQGIEHDEEYYGATQEELHASAPCSQASQNDNNADDNANADVGKLIGQVKQWSVEAADSEELLREYEVVVDGVVGESNDVLTGNEAELESFNPDSPPNKIVYRNRYCKVSPMIIIEYLRNEPTFRTLKLLFDWLRLNSDIISNCHHSNPEFVHKIMKLLNYCNIDIFTRKVFFEREFLDLPNVRENITDLHDKRYAVPLSEDIVFKGFDVFQNAQDTIDWEADKKLQVTPEEEQLLRLFKMIDFGFFLCKEKIYGYRFCVKSRRFTENQKKKREMKEMPASRRRDRRTARNANRKRNEGRTRRYSDRRNGIERKSYTSNEEKDTVEEGRIMPRKGYMRARNTDRVGAQWANLTALHGSVHQLSYSNGNSAAGGTSASTTTNSVIERANGQSSSGADEERSEANKTKKAEAMAKLCKHVEQLEEQLPQVVITPFIVVDTKALIEHTEIVKNLVKSSKVIVLIPNVVLQELDDLKKNADKARNAIRWLEQEFTRGNRHLRAQRDNENLQLLLKLPNKLDRDAMNFVKVAQFCNHLVCNYTNGPESKDFRSNIVTYLSGENWQSKNRQQSSIKYTGILDSIPVRYDQIEAFYAKFKPVNKK